MDDDAVGRQQAHLIRRAVEEAGIGPGRLWMHCFSIGGQAGKTEVDVFVHHSPSLPLLQRELLAHAACPPEGLSPAAPAGRRRPGPRRRAGSSPRPR